MKKSKDKKSAIIPIITPNRDNKLSTFKDPDFEVDPKCFIHSTGKGKVIKITKEQMDKECRETLKF